MKRLAAVGVSWCVIALAADGRLPRVTSLVGNAATVLAHPDHDHDHGGEGSDPALAEPPALGATACVDGFSGPYPCARVDLAAFMPLSTIGGGRGNDVWGWTDALTGREYALMGRTSGVSFVDVTNPAAPRYLGNLPTHSANSTWRSIKVFDDHAFVVSEAPGHGMQVFDLLQLRTIANAPVPLSESAHYSGFSTAHNLVVNEESGFAYAVGTNTCSGGLHIVDIRAPQSPVFAGCFSADGYTHDAQCVIYDGPDAAHRGREICFASNTNTLTIVDVTNKASPVQIARKSYADRGFTHQGWLTPDHEYFLLDDETDETKLHTNTRTHVFDVRNLDAPSRMAVYEGPVPSTDHNLYIQGNRAFEANYRSGLRILDVSNVAAGLLREVGFFDIVPADDKPGYHGAWNTYPFFSSGTTLVSGIEQGLYILRPAPGPLTGTDLIVSSTSGSRTADAGSTISLSAAVTNQGTTSAGQSSLAVYLSLDTVLDADDFQVGTTTVTALPAGMSAPLAINASIPMGASGARYLILRTDAGEAVDEAIENNNTRTHYVVMGADLIVAKLTAPSSVGPGDTFSINDVTENISERPSGATVTRFYLSKNGKLGPGDVELGSRNINGLAGFASSAGSTPVVIPSTTTVGSYNILAVADGDSAAAEISETNNLRRRKVVVQ
jgi:choice-of-anchor B domain-containing protein